MHGITQLNISGYQRSIFYLSPSDIAKSVYVLVHSYYSASTLRLKITLRRSLPQSQTIFQSTLDEESHGLQKNSCISKNCPKIKNALAFPARHEATMQLFPLSGSYLFTGLNRQTVRVRRYRV